MPDIAMCADNECPSRYTCFRFAAPPDPLMQCYGEFERGASDDRCKYYWPTYSGTVNKVGEEAK